MTQRRPATVAVAAAVATLLVGCVGGRAADNPFLQKGETQTSGSGSYNATLRLHTDQGFDEYQPIITDVSGTPVWEDKTAFVQRNFPGVTWAKDADVLWILSGDVGNSRVERVNGTWVQTFGDEGMPEFIAKWARS